MLDSAIIKTNEQIEINRILTEVAEYNASDLHCSVGNIPILRVDGELVPLRNEQVVTPEFMEKLTLFFLDESQRAVLEKNREIDFAYNFQNRIRFKVALFFQEGYLSASLRLIPSEIKSIKDLGLPRVVERFSKLSRGWVILAGPVGSGRTATAAALIEEINRTRGEHILTIERPIEYLFVDNKSIIEQREVGRDVPSFESALGAAFREDINVILAGEFPSKEAVRSSLDLAGGGRLVFGILEADSVPKVIEKVVMMFSKEEQPEIRLNCSRVLEGIVVQRLLPRVGGGRILVVEVLIPTVAVRSVIRDGSFYQLGNILETSREEGMCSLDRSMAELIKTGAILLDDALEHTQDPERLKTLVGR